MDGGMLTHGHQAPVSLGKSFQNSDLRYGLPRLSSSPLDRGAREYVTDQPNSLPYAVSQAGFVTGIALLTGLAFVTDWTIRLVVVNAKLSGRDSYIEVSQLASLMGSFGGRNKKGTSLAS